MTSSKRVRFDASNVTAETFRTDFPSLVPYLVPDDATASGLLKVAAMKRILAAALADLHEKLGEEHETDVERLLQTVDGCSEELAGKSEFGHDFSLFSPSALRDAAAALDTIAELVPKMAEAARFAALIPRD